MIHLFFPPCVIQLKYHETGKEKDCLPQVGQWNMMNKVMPFRVFSLKYALMMTKLGII